MSFACFVDKFKYLALKFLVWPFFGTKLAPRQKKLWHPCYGEDLKK